MSVYELFECPSYGSRSPVGSIDSGTPVMTTALITVMTKNSKLTTDLRCTGNFDAELGRGMQDFGVDIIFFSGVVGSNGSWSSVENEARDAGWCLDEWREAAAAKLRGDKRSSDKLD